MVIYCTHFWCPGVTRMGLDRLTTTILLSVYHGNTILAPPTHQLLSQQPGRTSRTLRHKGTLTLYTCDISNVYCVE